MKLATTGVGFGPINSYGGRATGRVVWYSKCEGRERKVKTILMRCRGT
jgi:hypothetical protein